MDFALLLGLILGALGGSALFFGIRMLARRLALLRRGRPATATVARWEHVTQGAGKRGGWLMHYAWADDTGKMHARAHDRFYYQKRLKVGERLAIRYDPADPGRALIDNRLEELPMPIALIVGGTITSLIALGILFGR
jgi:hypothetical protein